MFIKSIFIKISPMSFPVHLKRIRKSKFFSVHTFKKRLPPAVFCFQREPPSATSPDISRSFRHRRQMWINRGLVTLLTFIQFSHLFSTVGFEVIPHSQFPEVTFIKHIYLLSIYIY